ncbi:hypothetical protein RRF57_010825 [Xylaria bambusicola]|uniref:Uncharacterized protein n=1 Tax=Xylaria bambusicola TaxID=326684 RepID=A0AAN7UT61_9PEZI
MPPQRNRNAPSPVETKSHQLTSPQSSTKTEEGSLHGTLVELSAALAILEAVEPQQESPGSIRYRTLEVEQFDSASKGSFREGFDIKLSDILWAFAVIFSKSRTGKHVVASVLREQTQEDDNSKSVFTLFLTTNDGFWPDEYEEYKRRWEKTVNCEKTPLGFPSALWKYLTDFCSDRISDYAEQARKCVLGIPRDEYAPTTNLKEECNKTFDDIEKWSHGIHKLLIELKEDLSKRSWNKAVLVNKSWKALLALSDNSGRFQHLIYDRQCPDRCDLILKCVENLAKVRKAYLIFAKFQKILLQKGAQLKIELLGKTYASEAKAAVDRLISDQKGDKMRKYIDQAKKAIKGQKGTPPHCEIQMLVHFSRADKKGVWNLIGCSKRPCYACAHLIKASDFLFSESHGKAYHQYFLSIENWLEYEGNGEIKAAIKELRKKAVESVRRYRTGERLCFHAEPDSPTFQHWRFEGLRKLDTPPSTQ